MHCHVPFYTQIYCADNGIMGNYVPLLERILGMFKNGSNPVLTLSTGLLPLLISHNMRCVRGTELPIIPLCALYICACNGTMGNSVSHLELILNLIINGSNIP